MSLKTIVIGKVINYSYLHSQKTYPDCLENKKKGIIEYYNGIKTIRELIHPSTKRYNTSPRKARVQQFEKLSRRTEQNTI